MKNTAIVILVYDQGERYEIQSFQGFLAPRFFIALLMTPIHGAWGDTAGHQVPVIVFAAASTTNAITDIVDVYTQQTNQKITTSFASSSTLAKQIDNGAPAHIYVSANRKWMDYLEQKKMILADSRIDLLSNRIVLIAPVASTLKDIEVTPNFPLAGLLGDGRLALGDPGHVPAGMYGKKAFESLGVWDQIKDKLAPMKDVRAALAMVERAETPLGQVYATDAAISKKVRVVGTFPLDCHPPIVYPVAIVTGKRTPAVTQFMQFLSAPQARSTFERYGFAVR